MPVRTRESTHKFGQTTGLFSEFLAAKVRERTDYVNYYSSTNEKRSSKFTFFQSQSQVAGNCKWLVLILPCEIIHPILVLRFLIYIQALVPVALLQVEQASIRIQDISLSSKSKCQQVEIMVDKKVFKCKTKHYDITTNSPQPSSYNLQARNRTSCICIKSLPSKIQNEYR